MSTFSEPFLNKNMNEDQKKIFDLLMKGYNLFVTGSAGTGKSFLINEFCKANKDKRILITAPTGVAAQNVKGCTLHRAFKIPTNILMPSEPNKKNQKVIDMLDKTDILIIDEISMCREDVFNYVLGYVHFVNKYRSKMNIKPIQVVLVGDFYQLPPVITKKEKETWKNIWKNSDGFAFQAALWKTFDFHTVKLEKVIRQEDEEFINALNKIRKGDHSGAEFLNNNFSNTVIDDAIFLCSRNDLADSINLDKLSEINNQEYVYNIRKNGKITEIKKSDLVVDEELHLKIGARVMVLINSNEGLYQNGSLGYVTDLDDDTVSVELDNGNIVDFERYKWDIYDYNIVYENNIPVDVKREAIASYEQIPLKLAYAVTIHKSQGQTYDAVNIDVNGIFANGQLYVALSRCRSVNKICVNAPITPNKVKTSYDVMFFYNEDLI